MPKRRGPRSSGEEAALEGTARPAFVLDRHLFFWFTQVLDRRDRQLAVELKPYGVRMQDWRVLGALYSQHQLSMSELARLTSIERTTLSRTVERIVRAGWAVRLSDASDMRVTRLALTAEGERMFAHIWPVVSRLNEAACATLPPGMESLVRWALQEMCRSLDECLTRACDATRDGRVA